MDITWFLDGTRIVASGRGMPQERAALWIVSALTGNLQKLRDDVWGSAPSPDGSQIAFFNGGRNELWLMDARGQNAHKLLGAPQSDRFQRLSWSPDGKRIAYMKLRGSGDDAVDMLDIATNAVSTVVRGHWMRSCLWAPDGRILYSLANPPPQGRTADLWELPMNLGNGRRAGPPRRILAGDTFAFTSFTVSADSKRFAFVRSHVQTDVLIAELEGGGTRIREPRRLTMDDRVDWPSGWSRDSRQVLFYSDRNGNFDIFRQDVNGSMPELIAHGPEHERSPQLSPDGNWVLFFSSPEPAAGTPLPPERLLRVPVSGGSPQFVLSAGGFAGLPPISGERIALDTKPYPTFRCSMSATGRCVLGEANERQFVFSEFDVLNGSKRELVRLDMDPTVLLVWDLSPDGSRIAVTHRTPQIGKIRIVDLKTAAVREFSIDQASLDSIGWTADGQALFVTSYSSKEETLLRVALDGKSRVLYRFSAWFERPFPSPDGRYLAFGQLQYDCNVWMIENFR